MSNLNSQLAACVCLNVSVREMLNTHRGKRGGSSLMSMDDLDLDGCNRNYTDFNPVHNEIKARYALILIALITF